MWGTMGYVSQPCPILASTHSWQAWLPSAAVQFNTWNNSFSHSQLYAVSNILSDMYKFPPCYWLYWLEITMDLDQLRWNSKGSKCYSPERIFASTGCFTIKKKKKESGWLFPGFTNWTQHFLVEIESTLSYFSTLPYTAFPYCRCYYDLPILFGFLSLQI
jgi:hypothetical protein